MNIIESSISEANIELRQFDKKKLDDHVVVAIIGERQCGKTHLVCDLIKDKTSGLVRYIGEKNYSEDENEDEDDTTARMLDMVPIVATVVQYGNISIYNKEIISSLKRVLVNNPKKSSLSGFTLVIDDCLNNKNKWSDDITCLIGNNKQLKFSVFFTVMFPQSIPDDVRPNIDYVFLKLYLSGNSRRKVYEAYISNVLAFEVFDYLLNICDKNGDFLVIDNRSSACKIEDRLFWYKPKNYSEKKLYDALMTERHRYYLGTDSVLLNEKLVQKWRPRLDKNHYNIYSKSFLWMKDFHI